MPYFLREYPRLLTDANFRGKNGRSQPQAKSSMARIAIVAIVIAGFFLTGDISSGIQGGRWAVNAVAAWPRQITGWLASEREGVEPPVGPPQPAPPPATTQRQTPRRQAPTIPAAATASARLSALNPGDRLLVWCRDAGPGSTLELMAVDLIDPVRGEALLSRHLDAAAELSQLATATGQTPVRVMLETGFIERAATVSFQPVTTGLGVRPVGVRQAAMQPHHTGPVLAVLTVSRN